MTMLALDLGTTTGFAWAAAKGLVISGTWSFKPGRYDGGGVRYLRFQEALDRFHKTVPITRLFFEEVRAHKGTDAAHVYGGLMATLTAWCEKNGVPCEGVPVGKIKKFWTGQGNANKEMMLDMARQHGYEPEDDNEADAIALLNLKMSELEPDTKLTPAAAA
jgi:Holliday junction resolvasome RuvABC endonuclease subunit